MLKTIDEIKNVEIDAGVVVNGVDNANLMSVDSTEPIKTESDKIDKPDALETKVETKKEEKKSEESEKVEPNDLSEEKSSIKKEEKPSAKEEEKKKSDELVSKPETSKKVQKRIGKLTKQWRTAERERDFEMAKRLELEEELRKVKAALPVKDRPQKVDFEDEDEYIEALTEWKIDNKLKASQEETEKELKIKEEKDSVLDTYNGLDEAVENGKDKYDDFDEIVFDEDLILSSTVTHITLDTENPEDILYYLASNPEESKRISELDPVRSAMEIGKLEIRLLAEEEMRAKTEVETKNLEPRKKQSKAPAPITPIRTDGVVDKDPNDMSPKEYRAWRESQT